MKTVRLYFANHISHLLPETRFFALKRALYKWAGAFIGNNVRIASSASIYGSGKLSIGDNTWIGHETMIMASSSISIGQNCDIAPRVYIGTGTHIIDPSSKNVAGNGASYPIIIDDGCWICVNTTILPGTQMGTKSVLAAGSVAKGSIPSLELWGGILAKKIKSLA